MELGRSSRNRKVRPSYREACIKHFLDLGHGRRVGAPGFFSVPVSAACESRVARVKQAAGTAIILSSRCHVGAVDRRSQIGPACESQNAFSQYH